MAAQNVATDERVFGLSGAHSRRNSRFRDTTIWFPESFDMSEEKPTGMALRSEILTRAGVIHGFSTRRGGVSAAPFDSADFALLRDRGALLENQRRLALELGFDRDRLFQVQQVHGARIFPPSGASTVGRTLDRPESEASKSHYPEADALIAEDTGDTAGVRIADCVPVLIADQETGHVAAVHSGWKGVVANIVTHTLDALKSNPTNLVAAIGPCIGACCFEVSREVAEKIAAASARSCIVSTHVSKDGEDKAMVDLRLAVGAQLERGGIEHPRFDNVGGCTRCDVASYYSYRRDGDKSGRLIAVITAREPRAASR